MDFTNYKIFPITKKELEKKYSEEILNKYGKKLAYLYQNGYDVNTENDEEFL